MTFDFPLIIESIPEIFGGIWLTLMLFFLSMLAGTVLSVGVVLLRISNKWFLSWPAFAYTYFIRGTPILVQLFVVYHGLPQFDFIREGFLWPLFRDPFWCTWFTLTFAIGAYNSEILRAGILAVDKGLTEAAWALGLTKWHTATRIIAPIVIRLSLPAYGNEMVSILKATALASTVTLLDITGVARTIVAKTFAPYEIFISAALIYLAMTWIIQNSVRLVELRISKYVQ